MNNYSLLLVRSRIVCQPGNFFFEIKISPLQPIGNGIV